ncbi:outer membrane protein [Klebsiella pneumoniae]|uniref:Outer membrane protein n=1 Tax=Klebsiella pneumoniae TaxID=573 RepID=A0A377ZD58_KLEPN|nr:outer membrane protein [Klebsiella pneumoniae]
MSATTAGAISAWLCQPLWSAQLLSVCQQSQDIHHRNNQVVGVSFSLPFGQAGSLTTRFNHDKNYGSQLQSSYTGSAGEKNAFSYGLTASYDMPRENPNEASVAATVACDGLCVPERQRQRGRHQQQYSLGASAPLVAHQGGMTATPELGETFAIVEAPGAVGPGWLTALDSRLTARVLRSSLTSIPLPLTAGSRSAGSERPCGDCSSSTTVVPDSGAAVKVKFVTRTGYPWFAHVTLPDGAAPPLGAEVFDDNGRAVGAVGQGGLLYARVPQDTAASR